MSLPPSFDRTAVAHLAELAALSLSDTEADALGRDLRAIVAYIEELATVDVSSVSGVASPAPGALREDVLVPGLTREEALAAAPKVSEHGFAVPGFVGVSTTGGGTR